ncbi:MAG: hypothetical protein HY905_09590 [Deltaproteobacteria bacterium]|nr:hypothetical protein [Deltaproteobacteria bacterium]
MSSPRLEWSGERFALAWLDRRDRETIRVRTLDSTGAPVGPASVFFIADASAAPSLGNPAVVWNGSEFGVAWIEYHEGTRTIRDQQSGSWQQLVLDRVNFVRLDTAGSRVGDPQVVARDEIGPLAIGWTGAAFVAVWVAWSAEASSSDDTCGRSWRFRVASIDSAGVRIAPEELREPYRVEPPGRTRRAPAGNPADRPGCVPSLSMAWRENEVGLVWTGPDPAAPLHFGSVDGEDLRVLEPTAPLAVRTNGFANVPSLAWNGTTWGLAWLELNQAGERLRLAAIDQAGRQLDQRPSPSGRTTDPPWIGAAATGNGYGIVWPDTRDGDPQLHFARLDGAGRIVGGPIAVAGSSWGATPSLAWNGHSFGAAWVDDRPLGSAPAGACGEGIGDAVLFTTLDRDGQRTRERIELACGEVHAPRLAWTGESFGIAWREATPAAVPCPPSTIDLPAAVDPSCAAGPPRMHVHFARLDASGDATGSHAAFADYPYDAAVLCGPRDPSPSLAWNGSEFGIVWREFDWDEFMRCDSRLLFRRLRADASLAGPVHSFEDYDPFGLAARPGAFALASFWAVDRFNNRGVLISIGPADVRRDDRFPVDREVPGLSTDCGGDDEMEAFGNLGRIEDEFVVAWATTPWSQWSNRSSDGPPAGHGLSLAVLTATGQRTGPELRWPVRQPGAKDAILAVTGNTVAVFWTRNIGTATVLEFAAAQCD